MELLNKFKPAIEARENSDHPVYKIGAALYYKNKLLSKGYNLVRKTHPIMVELGSKKTTHAELMAILKVRHKIDLTGCTMVVYREDKEGNPAKAKPCEYCQELLKQYGVKYTIYTTETGWKKEKL